LLLTALSAQTAPPSSKVQLDAAAALELVNGKTEITTYRGRPAVHLLPLPGRETGDGAMLAILKGTDFRDGAIEVDVSGAPRPGAEPGMKGFIGIAFRAQSHGSAHELIYLRPSNGRAADQLTRITPFNTCLIRISVGSVCAKRRPACMSLTRIWNRVRGQEFGLRSPALERASTSTAPVNLV
jgi:hypothetical protein